MKSSRFFLPVLVTLALLSAQQVGAAHTIRHAVQQLQQHDQDVSHGGACEKCENYFQLGSALNVGIYTPPLIEAPAEAALPFFARFLTLALPAATARGPPAFLRKTA